MLEGNEGAVECGGAPSYFCAGMSEREETIHVCTL